MKNLIKTAVAGSEIYLRNKGELDEIKGLTLSKVTVTESAEGDKIVAVTFAESPNRYFASGKFAKFILDNVGVTVEKCNDTDYDFTEYNVKVTYEGKKKSKNSRMYNDWSIKF